MTRQEEPRWRDGERELRARLHGELTRVRPPAPPVDAVLTRGRALRARRRRRAGAGLAVLAAAAVGVALTAPGAPPSHRAPTVTLNVPDPRAPGGVFASGTAAGRPWRLAARDIADPGPDCLPAVLLDGHDGDLLAAGRTGPVPPITNVAFLTQAPARPGAAFVFVQLRPDVTRVTARLGSGRTLVVRPVTVTRCGEPFRLAGFASGPRGVRVITAYARTGGREDYTPPPGTFGQPILPPGRVSAGLWSNSGAGTRVDAAGRIGSGRIGRLSWTVSVTLGGEGQCYLGASHGKVAATRGAGAPGWSTRTTSIPATGAPQPPATAVTRSSVECQPPQAPPRHAGLSWLPIDVLTGHQIAGFAGTLSSRTSYLVATMADGSTRRLTPAVVAGRKYFALVVRPGARAVRLTLYDGTGHRFATTTFSPASTASAPARHTQPARRAGRDAGRRP